MAESEKPRGVLHTKLELTPAWVSALSLVAYIYMWTRGLRHWGASLISSKSIDPASITNDALHLSCVYAIETAVAIVFRRSTMYGWRPLDFVAHHLPFVVVTAGSLHWYPPTCYTFARTLPLCMLTSLNEAVSAARAIKLPGAENVEFPNRLYLFVVMVLLFCTEIAEAIFGIVNPDKAIGQAGGELGTMQKRARFICLLSLGAPMYHGLVVIPHCYKVVMKKMRGKSGSKDSESKESKPE